MLELILWPLLTNLLNHEPLEKFKALIELFWKKGIFYLASNGQFYCSLTLTILEATGKLSQSVYVQ